MMLRLVVSTLLLLPAIMASPLRIRNPSINHWYDLSMFGVGGVVDAHLLLEEGAVIEVKLADDAGEVVFTLHIDDKPTWILSSLIEGYEMHGGPQDNIRGKKGMSILVIEMQSEGIFMEMINGMPNSVVMSYPEDSWVGNENLTWERISKIKRVFIGGKNFKITYLKGFVLV